MKRHLPSIKRKNSWSIVLTVLLLFSVTSNAYCQTGNTLSNPIVAGTFNANFQYSNTQNTANFTNQHTARNPNDVFYKFTIGKKMLVTMTHCGSIIDTYMHLLDASGNVIVTNDDYSGDGACPESSLHSFIQRELTAGTYYIISEGYSISGSITTNITGYSSGEFDYPDIPNSYSTEPETVGSIGGSFGVSATGGATYSIPIEVPQGAGGMQPSLAIVYNSQSGNGMLGWGCNLSGLSAITRAPKDIYHDGTAKGLTHLADEAYYLDGQRLILSTGSSGGSGAIYYPESDPFTKITVKTTSPNTWFEVQSSNGLKYYYGSTASGRNSYIFNTTTRIHAWYLDYVEDPLGNYMDYTYSNYGNFLYPSTIIYGKNKNQTNSLQNTVTFSYDYRSNDYQYQPFVIDENVKGYLYYRLKSITTKTGSSTYRIYELQYDTTSDGSTTKFSRLTTVTEKNGAGESMKPIKLNWAYLPSFSQSCQTQTVRSTYVPLGVYNNTISYSDQNYIAADVNGDGLDDLIGIFPYYIYSYYYNSGNYGGSRTNIAFVNYASLNSSGNVQFTTGTYYDIGASFSIGNWSEQKESPSVLDFNGDGINDLLIPNVSIIQDINYKVVEFKFVGGTLNTQAVRYSLQRSSEMPVYATSDFNNDGKGDIVFIEKGHNSNNYPGEIVGLNSGTTLYRAAFNFNLPSKPEKMFVSDYNGDGLNDVLVFYNGGYTIFWNKGYGISTSTFSNSYKTTGTNVGNVWKIWTGDFNGDGLADFLLSTTMSSSWYFALNNGNGAFTKQLACTLGIYDQNFTDYDDDVFNCHIYDFDFDGKSDVVITKAMYEKKSDLFSTWGKFNKTYTYWMRSTGSSLTQVALATSDRSLDALDSKYLLGDFNGDGQPELMNYGYNCYSSTNANTDPIWRLYQNSNFNANRGKVTSVTNGLGSTTSITYASLGNGGIYTKGTGSTYPVADYTLPLHAVKTVNANNGVAGSTTLNYQYKGLKAHLQGKGLLGMTSQTVNNTTMGTTTESGVTAWNSTFHIPSRTYTKTTIDGKTAETNITTTIVDKNSKKYFAYPSTKTEKDLDGNTVTTSYQFNADYGYITEEKAEYGGTNMYKKIQYSTYVLAGNSYKPRLITKTQKHTDDASTFTQTTYITYNLTKGYKDQIIENYQTLPLTTDYTYDAFGNVKTMKSTGSGVTQLIHNSDYDASNRFVVKTYTSPASSVSTFTYDTWGNVLTEKDESNPSNILTTTHAYDNWGNRTSTISPEGLKTTCHKGWNNNAVKRFFTLTQGTGQPWVKTWYDNQGREVLVETVGAKSINIKQATNYNSKGLVTGKQTTTGNLITTENYTYDGRGRVATQSSSAGQSVSYSYGNRTITSVSNGKTTTKTFDAWGGIKSITDPVSTVSYTYKSVGKPQSVSTGGATFSMTYNNTGTQKTLTDPNAGTITFHDYDALGRVSYQVDAKGNDTEWRYDSFGRLYNTVINGVSTPNYTYGTSGDSILRLIKEQTGNNYVTYSYDNYGRVRSESRKIDGVELLTFSYGYDTKGQLSQITYPGGLQVSRQYDAYGNLQKVLTGTQTVWELTGNTGTVTTTQLGGALTATETRNSQGLLTNLKTVKGSTVLHNMGFDFNGTTGNLTSRTGMTAQTESFFYDNADRLTTVQQGSATAMGINYFPNGNIQSKTGLGVYSYNNLPHAVSFVENTDELIHVENQQISHTPFNKVSSISEKIGTDNYQLDITYGPDRQRWKSVLKKNNVLQKTTIFAGDYEIITENGVTRQLYYISGGDGLAAVYVKNAGQDDKIYYPFTDHLGSIVKLADSNGTEVFKASYDAWGNQTVTNNTFKFHRGYTGHEHLPEFNLINMNGRMYDPVLGRFLSPDPFVQAPDFSQSFNRYSYCVNNPLRYTDPDGEWWGVDDLVIAGAGFVFGYTSYGLSTGNWGWKAVGAGGIGAVSAWIGYNTAGLSTGVINNSTWTHVGGMAINSVANQIMPSTNIPIGNHFGLSVSPSFGMGASGLTAGVNLTGTYTNGDFRLAAGIGAGDNYSGWNAGFDIGGYGAGYGRTYFGNAPGPGGISNAQAVGSITAFWKGGSFTLQNDVKPLSGVKKDRWRTNAFELTIDNFSFGNSIYTNDGEADSKAFDSKEPVDFDARSPIYGKNSRTDRGAWKVGKVFSSPSWIGYRAGNQITRIGYSLRGFQDFFQNGIHTTFIGDQNYYLDYSEFNKGWYSYSGYNNPYSLWGR